MAESLQGQISVGSVIENISKKSSLKWIVVSIVIGIVVLVIGLAVGIAIGNSLKSSVKKDLVVSGANDTELTDILSTEPSDDSDMVYHYDFYMFNITNVEEVLLGEKPILSQCGPYSYKKYPLKMEASFSDNNVEVTYLYRYVYELDYENTEGDPFEDQITMINPFYMSSVGSYTSEEDMVLTLSSAALDEIVGYLTDDDFEVTVILYTGCSILASTKSSLISSYSSSYFYSTWANATTDPTGWPDNMRISKSTASKISLGQATSMWTCTSASSFCNSEGASLWYSALVGDDSTAYPSLVSTFGLLDSQMSLVLQWLTTVWEETTVDSLLSQYTLSNINQIGYAQWGQGSCIGGDSISNLYGLSIPVEIAIWAEEELGLTGFGLSASTSQLLLSGPNRFTDPASLYSFINLVSSSQFLTIFTTWGLDQASAIVTAEYLNSIMATFVVDPLTEIIFSEQGGLFSTRTPEEWIWGQHDGASFADPLETFLIGNYSSMALLYNDSTVNEAASRNQTIKFNTGKKDLDKLNDIIADNGVTEIGVWAEEVFVGGTDGLQFEPFQTAPASFEPHTWSQILLRSIDYEFDDTFVLDGIELYRFIFQDYMFQENTTFYMPFAGFWNMTGSNNGAPLFLGTPHFSSSASWVGNVTGLHPENDTQQNFIGLEPFTGMTMSYRNAFQVNYLFDAATLEMFSMFYPGLENISTPLMFPVYWTSEWGMVSDEKAKDFKNNVHAQELLSQRVLLGCVISGTVVLVVGLTLLAIWLANRNAAATSVVTPVDNTTTTTTDAIPPPVGESGLADTNSGTPKMLPMDVATKDQWESEYASGKANFGAVSGSDRGSDEVDEEAKG